jgi:hypothetical protein
MSSCFFFFLLYVCVFELIASHLRSRHPSAWATLQCIWLWLFWKWGLTNILPGLASNHVLPISTSQIARITGMSHWCPDNWWILENVFYYLQAFAIWCIPIHCLGGYIHIYFMAILQDKGFVHSSPWFTTLGSLTAGMFTMVVHGQ